MTLPFFRTSDDPGPSFADLLRRVSGASASIDASDAVEVAHGTTIVALRFADGVVMAGDRRATAG